MASINETIIEAQVVEALRSCFDPEIPVNIYELGLVYEVKVSAEGAVTVQMTLTSPHCPAVQSLPAEIESKVRAVDGVTDVKIAAEILYVDSQMRHRLGAVEHDRHAALMSQCDNLFDRHDCAERIGHVGYRNKLGPIV